MPTPKKSPRKNSKSPKSGASPKRRASPKRAAPSPKRRAQPPSPRTPTTTPKKRGAEAPKKVNPKIANNPWYAFVLFLAFYHSNNEFERLERHCGVYICIFHLNVTGMIYSIQILKRSKTSPGVAADVPVPVLAASRPKLTHFCFKVQFVFLSYVIRRERISLVTINLSVPV